MPRYFAGVDLGTSSARAVIGNVTDEGIVIVGYGEVENAGMRKGSVVNIDGAVMAIDRALGEAEKMCGCKFNQVTANINGHHILSTRVDGMVAIGGGGTEVTRETMARLEEVAISGKLPENREILDLIPHDFAIDGQSGVREPVGMKGSRLEMRATVISALAPYCESVRKAFGAAELGISRLVVGVEAGARAVLLDRQMENGVGYVDFGASTTGVAVFDEGDLKYVGVVPVGSNNITNDLAMILKTEIDVAEEIKRRFVTAEFGASEKDIVIKRGHEELVFARAAVDEIVQARLDDIFEAVYRELKAAGYAGRLPEGIVLSGGGSKLRALDVYARGRLGAAVRVGIPRDVKGVGEAVAHPEWAVAVGLMVMGAGNGGGAMAAEKKKKGGGLLRKILGSFK
jgi:cell division protein FtsA